MNVHIWLFWSNEVRVNVVEPTDQLITIDGEVMWSSNSLLSMLNVPVENGRVMEFYYSEQCGWHTVVFGG